MKWPRLKRDPTPAEYSGELRFSGSLITYRSVQSNWSLPLTEVRLIAEYTNSDGPYLDDYFFVFLTAPEHGWYEASYYAKGKFELLTAISDRLGAPLECHLTNSTDYKTRIMWPPELRDQPLMEFVPPPPRTLLQKFVALSTGTRELRLTPAARQFLEKA